MAFEAFNTLLERVAMTKQEATIVAAYTGFLIGNFSDMHEYVEKIMGGPVFTHQMGNKDFAQEIKDKAQSDFASIEIN